MKNPKNKFLHLPQIPGGKEALKKYIETNLIYPEKAKIKFQLPPENKVNYNFLINHSIFYYTYVIWVTYVYLNKNVNSEYRFVFTH